MKGRRRPDLPDGKLAADLRPGDYWKITDLAGGPGNLTGTCWRIVVPMNYGFATGKLVNHTVREHEDGTISVRPNDGSSNSILITGHRGEQWHGYIERGVLQKV